MDITNKDRIFQVVMLVLILMASLCLKIKNSDKEISYSKSNIALNKNIE